MYINVYYLMISIVIYNTMFDLFGITLSENIYIYIYIYIVRLMGLEFCLLSL